MNFVWLRNKLEKSQVELAGTHISSLSWRNSHFKYISRLNLRHTNLLGLFHILFYRCIQQFTLSVEQFIIKLFINTEVQHVAVFFPWLHARFRYENGYIKRQIESYFKKYKIKTYPNMYILMYFKIESDQSRITRNVFRNAHFQFIY